MLQVLRLGNRQGFDKETVIFIVIKMTEEKEKVCRGVCSCRTQADAVSETYGLMNFIE